MEDPQPIEIVVHPHPLLDLMAFVTLFPQPLGELTSKPSLKGLLSLEADAPLQSSDEVRKTVRDLLRHGGFKPTGRSKPAAEYLIKVANQGALSSINVAVDACNAISLHSGLPISVVDLDLVQPPLEVAVAPSQSSYVFNQSGQTLDIGGLLCFGDADGPCANAVKDSQRTKTSASTTRTLSLIWGTTSLPGRAAETEAWYRDLLIDQGAMIESVL